jgi:hypothetical protein
MTVLLLPFGAFLGRTVLSYARRKRQSLVNSHQQSWWLTDRVIFTNLQEKEALK